MSGTPMADAIVLRHVGRIAPNEANAQYNDLVDLCRTLERELAALRAPKGLPEEPSVYDTPGYSVSLVSKQNYAALRAFALASEARVKELEAENAKLRLPPDETMSEHPGCAFCMSAGTEVRPGMVCPKCGDRLPTKGEYRLMKLEQFWHGYREAKHYTPMSLKDKE